MSKVSSQPVPSVEKARSVFASVVASPATLASIDCWNAEISIVIVPEASSVVCEDKQYAFAHLHQIFC